MDLWIKIYGSFFGVMDLWIKIYRAFYVKPVFWHKINDTKKGATETVTNEVSRDRKKMVFGTLPPKEHQNTERSLRAGARLSGP